MEELREAEVPAAIFESLWMDGHRLTWRTILVDTHLNELRLLPEKSLFHSQ